MKICFAFITQNGLNNIWEKYFEHSTDHYIIIHSREALTEDINVTNSERYYRIYNDGWGKLVRLQLALIQKAKDAGCDKIIFLSESCVPLRPINELYEYLLTTNGKTIVSYIKFTAEMRKLHWLIPKFDKKCPGEPGRTMNTPAGQITQALYPHGLTVNHPNQRKPNVPAI